MLSPQQAPFGVAAGSFEDLESRSLSLSMFRLFFPGGHFWILKLVRRGC